MEATAKDWLDSLSAGTCEVGALLKGITELLRKSPDEGWEVLSIVDQYYRRGKITASVFATLKTHLQGLLMGKNRPEVSVPMPRSKSVAGTPLSASATTPVSAESTPAASTVRSLPIASSNVASSAPVAAGSASMTVGSVLRNRYRVLGVLGHGGTGTVFEALDLYRLDADNGHGKVAIKVLHPNVIRRPPLFSELRREFQRLQLLSHPCIVRVHEFDRDGETAFFTMEHLSGVLLSRVIAVRESAPMSREHALAMLRDLCDAIGYAHGRGIVHGDVSPGNVFVCNDGEVRVLDFGSNGVATPSFSSCQVLEGEAAEARDDLYSLACIAYILLAGSHPFQEQTALNARAAKLSPKRPPGLKPVQWRALRAGLNFERSDRPVDVQAWASLLIPRPPVQRLPGLPTILSAMDARRLSARWPALAALLIVIVGVGWWVSTHLDTVLRTSRDVLPVVQTAPQPTALPPTGASDPVLAPTNSVAAEPLPDAARERPADDRPNVPSAAPPRVASSAPPNSARPVGVAPTPAPPATATSRTDPGTLASASNAPTSPGARARLELTADNVEATPGDGLVRIMVRRTRSLRGDVSFNWWTESGTAKPGRDFGAVASHVEQIEDGKGAVNLVIPILADPERRQARSFYVVIDEASPTAAVGPRTLAMVTIPEPN